MTEGGVKNKGEVRECLAAIKGEVTNNNLSKCRVRIRTHGVVRGMRLAIASYPIFIITVFMRKHKESQ